MIAQSFRPPVRLHIEISFSSLAAAASLEPPRRRSSS
jgi:hypothetical protein